MYAKFRLDAAPHSRLGSHFCCKDASKHMLANSYFADYLQLLHASANAVVKSTEGDVGKVSNVIRHTDV